MWLFTFGEDVVLGNSLIRPAKLTTNADPDKYKHYDHGIEFDERGSFPFLIVMGLLKMF